jgi:long-chain acyl-CoA synthetase
LLGERLRVLAAGGAGLSQDLFLWFANLGLPIIQGYGLTEASPVVCSNRSDNPQSNCVGPAIRDTELHIDAEERLWVKGPGVMLGYWEDDAATKKRIIDGWLDTGDRAAWTSAGAICILGRCDDRIVLSTGEKVDPSVIEDRMLQLPAIRRALLIGHQQKFLAAIVISETADESLLLNQIQLHLRDLPRYCIPKRLIIVKDDWTHEAGLVNHKGTIIRSAILDKYRLEIGRLFHASLGRRQDTLDPCQTEQQADPQHQQRDGVQQ